MMWRAFPARVLTSRRLIDFCGKYLTLKHHLLCGFQWPVNEWTMPVTT